MKHLALLTVVLVFVLMCSSCFKEPTAMFSYDPATNPEAGEIITFKNESLDAKDFSWDFGNGLTSEEEMPTSRFKPPGNYTVILTASNTFKTSTYSENILINPPTILEFSVYDPDGNPLKTGNADLYPSYGDAISGMNLISSKTSDLSGHVTFNNLEAITYYLVFTKYTTTGMYISAGNIGPLAQNQVNEYWGTAEYFSDVYKSALSTGSMLKKKD